MAFYDPQYGTYDIGVQTSYALPLFLQLVPPELVEDISITLLNNIVAVCENHLSTGIIGTKYLMLVLHSMGRDDIALQLAENLDYPSWGYMIVNPTEPATTLWELWGSPDGSPGMDSRNHIMFGSVGDWFYKALAGIDHPAGDVGYAQITIAPQVVGDLLAVDATFMTGKGNISVSWQKQGGDMICGSAPEGYVVSLDCSSIGSEGVIEEITFASYGTPRGTCGAYGYNTSCHATASKKSVEFQCLGKKSCSFLANADILGDVECGEVTPLHLKKVHVQAKCSVAASTSFSLKTSIPVGSTATVTLPALDLSNVQVTINGITSWNNHKYVKGAEGVAEGFQSMTTLNFVVGSGEYHFMLTGSSAEYYCFNTTENFNLTFSCPPNTVMTQFPFASFGTPYGECGNLILGDCNAGSTKFLLDKYCLMENSCTIPITAGFFQDPCYGTPKSFASQVTCANI